jgi:hypothetical protein
LAPSEPVSTHCPLHSEKPLLQLTPQVPLQVAVPLGGTGQAVPQRPQLAVSLVVSTHTPLQSVWPVGHFRPQTPPTHTPVPPPLLGHTMSHAPQFCGSVASTAQPLGHLASVPEQVVPHLPPEQT